MAALPELRARHPDAEVRGGRGRRDGVRERRRGGEGRRLTTGAHRRWILVNAVAVSALLNAGISAGIAALSAGDRTRIPLWATPLVGGPSTVCDTVGTFFVLPFVTTVIVTAAVRRDLRRGTLTPLSCAPWLELLPANAALRGVALGVACVALLSPPAVAIIVAFDFGPISASDFVLYKAILGVGLGLLLTPLIARWAMAEVTS